MLAEHLEDPRPLFRTISHLLAEDGLVFFSTAIESAQRDHVYEFNQESQPLKMAEDAGLRVTRLVSDASTRLSALDFFPAPGNDLTAAMIYCNSLSSPAARI